MDNDNKQLAMITTLVKQYDWSWTRKHNKRNPGDDDDDDDEEEEEEIWDEMRWDEMRWEDDDDDDESESPSLTQTLSELRFQLLFL